MRRAGHLACLLALTCFLPLAAARTLQLAATEYPPYYSESLTDGGPVTEITVAALRHAGYEVQVRFLPWVRALRAGEMGEVDGLIGVWHSPERERSFLYSLPVVANRIVLCRHGHHGPDRFAGFPALKPYVIGVVRGYADPPGLAEARIHTEAVTDDLQNLRKLLLDRIDLVLIDSRVGHYLLSRHLPEALTTVQCLEPTVQEPAQYLVVSRHASDAAQIVNAFNTGLQQLHATGDYEKIAAKWGL